jgi:hypothetical protein
MGLVRAVEDWSRVSGRDRAWACYASGLVLSRPLRTPTTIALSLNRAVYSSCQGLTWGMTGRLRLGILLEPLIGLLRVVGFMPLEALKGVGGGDEVK